MQTIIRIFTTRMNLKVVRTLTLLLVCFITESCGAQSQSALAETARSTQRIAEFLKCCSKIQDQNVIGELALTGNTDGRRRTALDFITNQVVLAKVAEESKDPGIQIFAKQRLDAVKAGRSVDEVPTVNWFKLQPDGTLVDVEKSPSTTWGEAWANVAVTVAAPTSKSWPDTAGVTLTGKLDAGFELGGLGEKGFQMIQHVTLKTTTNQFVLRLTSATKSDPPQTDKPLSLVVDGLKGGISVAPGTDYEVEGLLIKKAVAESVLLQSSTTNALADRTNTALKRLVSRIVSSTPAVSGEDSNSAFLRQFALQRVYERILQGDLQENPSSEVILVRTLQPCEVKKPQ